MITKHKCIVTTRLFNSCEQCYVYSVTIHSALIKSWTFVVVVLTLSAGIVSYHFRYRTLFIISKAHHINFATL